MHPDITTALAHARIDDLHREGAKRRRARQASPQRRRARPDWTLARATVARWAAFGRASLAARQSDPACCPA